MRVHQAYRYALDPTPEQARLLASHCGAVRVQLGPGPHQGRDGPARGRAVLRHRG
ncbi:helix-turn-helix domain-containing protein [Streptosporangium sp. OZ121]|uniref:helix-turn-helix domain-containing protein n=1 Tax=Streptosporangium sp. OZ121 TaxID=3444183 RepID=UPI003F792CE9